MTTTDTPIARSSAPAIPFDAALFLARMRGRSFTHMGMTLAIQAHLMVTPGHRLTRSQILDLLRVRAEWPLKIAEEVISFEFYEAEDGYIYSPQVTALAAQGAKQ